MQNTVCPWGQREQIMVEKAPAKPASQRGRPKRSPRDQRVHVLTLRVPEELFRRLDAYTTQGRLPSPTMAQARRCASDVAGQRIECYKLKNRDTAYT